ncbi:MAG: hypothetical protein AB7O73_02325 [Bacteroidia bacterium]
MITRKIYLVSGYLSIVFGLLSAGSIYRPGLIFIGMLLGIAGFFMSGINIYLNNKFEFDDTKWPKGYIGMLLSSVPILFMLFLIFNNR